MARGDLSWGRAGYGVRKFRATQHGSGGCLDGEMTADGAMVVECLKHLIVFVDSFDDVLGGEEGDIYEPVKAHSTGLQMR